MSGYGSNCEEETKFAFENAGGIADIMHINDLIAKPKMLSEYQILVFLEDFLMETILVDVKLMPINSKTPFIKRN